MNSLGRRTALTVANLFLAPAIAYGHQGGGVPHLHPHGMEFLVVWTVVLVGLLPGVLLKRK